MKRTPNAIRQQELLAKVPTEATRIYVLTETGQLKYKDIAQLADTDEIQVNKKDDPIVMTAKPGRKRNVTIAPANSTVSEIIKRKKVALDTDPIIQAAKTDPESPNILHQVVLALGDEAASIGFERIEAERKGEETSQLSNRRVAALKALAETWLKRKDQLGSRGIDMESSAFKALFGYVVETMKDAVDSSGVRPELVEAIFAKFGRTVDSDEWVAEAKNRMKSI